MVTVVQLDVCNNGQYLGYSVGVNPTHHMRTVLVSTDEHIVLRLAEVNEVLRNTHANLASAVRPRSHVHINVVLGLDVLLYGGIAW